MDLIDPLAANYVTALKLIDQVHAQDPRSVEGRILGHGGEKGPVPFELDYASKMTLWLAKRKPDPSPALQLACRAQHFRRYISTHRQKRSHRCFIINTCIDTYLDGKSPAAATP